MMSSVRFSLVTLAAGAALAASTPAQVQRRSVQQKPVVRIEASLQVGSSRYLNSATGKCEYAPVASIYDVASEMYRVEQENDSGSMTLTLWKPKDGSAPMIALSVSAGGGTQEVRTVKGQPFKGSGTIAIEKSAKGGTFRVDAKSGSGAAVKGTITCSTFTPAIAEGGD